MAGPGRPPFVSALLGTLHRALLEAGATPGVPVPREKWERLLLRCGASGIRTIEQWTKAARLEGYIRTQRGYVILEPARLDGGPVAHKVIERGSSPPPQVLARDAGAVATGVPEIVLMDVSVPVEAGDAGERLLSPQVVRP